MERLKEDFFKRDTVWVARELIGKLLCHESPAGLTIGRIVETEAYLGKNDPACHAARGLTKRNAVMFGPAGHHYVYVSYGVHLCYNVTTDREELPAAVLLRALEPCEGIPFMQARRGNQVALQRLCAGPGNLTRAMGITMAQNGEALAQSVLYYQDDGVKPPALVTTKRIGISCGQDLRLRFYWQGSPYISRK